MRRGTADDEKEVTGVICIVVACRLATYRVGWQQQLVKVSATASYLSEHNTILRAHKSIAVKRQRLYVLGNFFFSTGAASVLQLP